MVRNTFKQFKQKRAEVLTHQHTQYISNFYFVATNYTVLPS